jgi:PAS domain S-box-containing protein
MTKVKEKIKILYVDDQERNTSSFKGAFRRDFQIDTAISAKEGKGLLEKNDYHILLTDQRMPNTTGVEFLSEICELYPDIMRILITAYSDIEAVINAINHGKIYKYINKPYDDGEVKNIFYEAYQVYQYRKGINQEIKRYKETFDKSNDPIFLINTKGEFIDTNMACLKMLDMTRADLLSTPCSYFFKEKSEKRSFMKKLKENDKVDDFEVAIKAQSDVADCLMSIRKIKFEFDNSIAYHGSLKNITFIKKATHSAIQEIVEKNEGDRQKFASILHESLAQKLAGIKFYMAALKEDNKENTSSDEKVLNAASSVLDKAIEELREVCVELVPQSITLGVDKALEEVCKLLENNFNVIIKRDLRPIRLEELSPSSVFRLCQELLVSLVEDQHQDQLEIELKAFEGTFEFLVNIENGIVFTEQIKSLQIKVKNFGGKLELIQNSSAVLSMQL